MLKFIIFFVSLNYFCFIKLESNYIKVYVLYFHGEGSTNTQTYLPKIRPRRRGGEHLNLYREPKP